MAESNPDDPNWLRTVQTAASLFDAPFAGTCNAVRWLRRLPGDFAEIAHLAGTRDPDADRVPLDDDALAGLGSQASAEGCLALHVLGDDLRFLRERDHEPSIELLRRSHATPTRICGPTCTRSTSTPQTRRPEWRLVRAVRNVARDPGGVRERGGGAGKCRSADDALVHW
ncbi:MAG: hypothetical protein ABIP94_17795 [Planctomycetota bacterium]